MVLRVSGSCDVGGSNSYTCTGVAKSQSLTTQVNGSTGDVTLSYAAAPGAGFTLYETGVITGSTSKCQGNVTVGSGTVGSEHVFYYQGSGVHAVTGPTYVEGVSAAITHGSGNYSGAGGFLSYTLAEPNTGSRGYNLYMTVTLTLPAPAEARA